ncbi:hypothetical protein ACIBUY_28065 [Streptomyces sp. NPDC050085]|uniref:hypothetical protein n=1 Tax=Streptomyces sp. NPDC050085 TaxID=3365600 RepID=UPI0037AA077C
MGSNVHAVGAPSAKGRRKWLLALGSIFALFAMTLALSTPAEAATKKVCAPKKCVKVDTNNKKKYCNPGSGCGKKLYRQHSGYCSSSMGCVSYKGKNYVYVGGPALTSKQRQQVAKCAVGLGWTVFSSASTAGTAMFVGGVAVAAWGCT